jgi:hypothetical protein
MRHNGIKKMNLRDAIKECVDKNDIKHMSQIVRKLRFQSFTYQAIKNLFTDTGGVTDDQFEEYMQEVEEYDSY